jgi:hypothetical protein
MFSQIRQLQRFEGERFLPNSPTDPLPLHLPMKNSNCLLFIVIIPAQRWIKCREEAGGTSSRCCWTSLKTSALRLRHASVRPRSGPWLTFAAYAVLARPCIARVATATSAGVCRQRGYEMRFLRCGTPPPTKPPLLCWPISGIRRLASSPGSKPSSWKKGDAMIFGAPRGWARCSGLSIRHLFLQGQWQCHYWRHREVVHEEGRRWR